MIRLNKFIAERLNVSRRKADELISQGLVTINGQKAVNGMQVNASTDSILFKNNILPNAQPSLTILFNKPVGFVCSKRSQGSNTIYDILPEKYHHLNTIGRIDKNSGGLLVLTNNGHLNQQLAHPSNKKIKIYTVTLDKPLANNDADMLTKGVQLADGLSSLKLAPLDAYNKRWQVTLHEGRNRQIRRSFDALGYTVTKLIRIQFGDYSLSQVPKPKDILELN